jgi:hypothetical protein
MRKTSDAVIPLARKKGLIVKEVADEVLVYDLDRNKAHCLNPAAALIWEHCDGKKGIDEIATRVASATGMSADREVVLLALTQLGKAGLLEGETLRVDRASGLSRRDLIKRIGVAAVAVPLVTSILAPTASATTSCGGSCFNSDDCPTGCKTCSSAAGNRCVAP